jgi:hypothetical protein
MKKNIVRRNWPEVLRAEIDEIRRRRSGQQTNDDALVGLAISGGGIRSATFALGVLEALKKIDLLNRIHYLSTVSGGGYIGAWLSASCKRHAGWLGPAADWNDSIRHLRRYSNYLSPKVGFFSADTWSMFTVWLRNTLLVQLTVVLAIACALLVPRPLLEGFRHWPQAGNLRWTTVVLFLLGVVGIAGNQLLVTTTGKAPLLQAKNWLRGLAGAAACLAIAWFYGSLASFDPFHGGRQDYKAAAPIAALLAGAAFLLQPAVVRVVQALWRGDRPPRQINYTQGWVQGLVVLPMLATGYLVAAVLWGETTAAPGTEPGLHTLDSYGAFLTTAWRYWPFPISVLFVSIWLLSFCSVRDRRDWKGLLAALASPFVAVTVLHALLCAIMVLLHYWAAQPPAAAGAWHAFVWGPPLVLYAFSLTVVALIGMMGRQSSEGVREWWSRLGAWLAIYGFAWMVIAVAAVYGPLFVSWITRVHPWTSMSAVAGWLGTVAAGLFAGHSGSTSGTANREKPPKSKTLEVVAKVAPFVFIAGLLIGVATVLDAVVALNSGQTWSTVGGAHEDPSAFLKVSLVLLSACVAALLVMAARVDINEFSLNAFYRSRLVRCYLGATRFRAGERHPQNFTGFDDGDDVKLCELASGQGMVEGPLHVVNGALNLGGSSDLALHTRHSASFTLSPLYCGSSYLSRQQTGDVEELGYVATDAYGGPFGTPTLGQAISVSGAAASPNMGYHTSPVVAFLLTVFNLRLGWWFPNPAQSGVALPSPRFNLRYLFAELFGNANDKSKFLMISDGGHFENLAAYELVRRRCRVVIISDGECDPELTFAGLGALIRMCDVDFGVKIHINVGIIRLEKDTPWSASRFAVGRIVYGGGTPDGVLIYLKASMTGREDTPVLQYKSSHSAFPHETTGDQFYGEDQFESYRQLGCDIATQAFDPVKGERDSIALATRLLGERTPAAAQAQKMR